MKLQLIPLLALFLLLPNLAEGKALVMDVEGMTCAGCRDKVKKVLEPLDFVANVITTDSGKQVCVETSADHDRAAIDTALGSLGYSSANFAVEDVCPKGVGEARDPWDGKMTGRDVTTISQGEEFDLTASLVAGKFTIVDFGAPWCGPCHEAADRLSAYLDSHSDVAVRVVNLESKNVTETYALPAAQQYLQYAPGIPWFQVYGPRGNRIYQGLDLDKVLKTIGKKRAKLK